MNKYDFFKCKSCGKMAEIAEAVGSRKDRCRACGPRLAVHRRAAKKSHFPHVVPFSVSDEQLETLRLWAAEEYEGNVSRLIRDVLFGGQKKVGG